MLFALIFAHVEAQCLADAALQCSKKYFSRVRSVRKTCVQRLCSMPVLVPRARSTQRQRYNASNTSFVQLYSRKEAMDRKLDFGKHHHAPERLAGHCTLYLTKFS